MNRDTLRENVDDNYMASYIANDAEHVCVDVITMIVILSLDTITESVIQIS